MYGGFILLGCSIFISIIFYELSLRKNFRWNYFIKFRNIIVIIFWIIVLPIAIHEYITGQFSSIYWALFLNTWEVFCFTIGFFLIDFMIFLGLNKVENLKVW